MANIKRMNIKRDEPPPIPNEGAKKMNRSGTPQPITIHIQ
tara:strand:+ start:958 stop:1077 length:120 start_codon:yes stop_codon:yes gene_type:complete